MRLILAATLALVLVATGCTGSNVDTSASVDPGSEFLQSTLTPEQWATFVQAAKQLGDPKDLEAADYESSLDGLRAAPPVGVIPAVVLTSDKRFDFGAGGDETWPAWLLRTVWRRSSAPSTSRTRTVATT